MSGCSCGLAELRSQSLMLRVDLIGVFRYHDTYPEAIELFASGKLKNVGKLVTTRFALSDANSAFECLERGTDQQGNLIMKLMVGDYRKVSYDDRAR